MASLHRYHRCLPHHYPSVMISLLVIQVVALSQSVCSKGRDVDSPGSSSVQESPTLEEVKDPIVYQV